MTGLECQKGWGGIKTLDTLASASVGQAIVDMPLADPVSGAISGLDRSSS